MEVFQRRYKEESKGQGGDLVLFTDALEHLTRLSRVRCRPSGCLMPSRMSGAYRHMSSKCSYKTLSTDTRILAALVAACTEVSTVHC